MDKILRKLFIFSWILVEILVFKVFIFKGVPQYDVFISSGLFFTLLTFYFYIIYFYIFTKIIIYLSKVL